MLLSSSAYITRAVREPGGLPVAGRDSRVALGAVGHPYRRSWVWGIF